MIATLRFSLPDEQPEFETAVQAPKWRGVVESLDSHLRNLEKYDQDPPGSEFYQKVRDYLTAELNSEGLNLYP